ncbi:MAG: tRNA (adenosine(37)-N6)-dimethylallyltransferase MiaA [Patescibacteria group bacterium]
MNHKNNKIIVILGPTASGKTKLAVQLALKFNGEIVSADSRQVYRGMDIGTGKDLRDYKLKVKSQKLKIIKYHLINVISPKQNFNLAKYQKLAFKAIDDILKRGKLPILVGGSGLYMQAVVDNFQLSYGKPDLILRKKLEKLTINQLFAKIKKLSLKMVTKINNSDKKNKCRLIRYAEILLSDKAQPPLPPLSGWGNKEKYKALIIGLTCSRQELKKRIYKRIINRLEKEKMINEVKRLHKQGLSWKKMEAFGLEYKFISLYLQNKLTYEEMVEKLNIASSQFANRQMSWFRRWERQGAEINWVKDGKKVEKLIKMFLQ